MTNSTKIIILLTTHNLISSTLSNHDLVKLEKLDNNSTKLLFVTKFNQWLYKIIIVSAVANRKSSFKPIEQSMVNCYQSIVINPSQYTRYIFTKALSFAKQDLEVENKSKVSFFNGSAKNNY